MRGSPRGRRFVAAVALALLAWAVHGQSGGSLRAVTAAGRHLLGSTSGSTGTDAATLGRVATAEVTAVDVTKRIVDGALVAILAGLAVMNLRRRSRSGDPHAARRRALGRIDFAPLRAPPSL